MNYPELPGSFISLLHTYAYAILSILTFIKYMKTLENIQSPQAKLSSLAKAASSIGFNVLKEANQKQDTGRCPHGIITITDPQNIHLLQQRHSTNNHGIEYITTLEIQGKEVDPRTGIEVIFYQYTLQQMLSVLCYTEK